MTRLQGIFGGVLISIVAIAVVSMMGSSAFAVSSGGIGGRPAHPVEGNPRTQSIFIYTLDNGATKTDEVLVSNNSDETRTVRLYAVDGVTTNTGAYTCKQEAEALSGAGAWVKLAESEVTLGPGDTRLVGFTVTVPASADVGEHSACLVFENKTDEGETQGGVHIRTRQAIRMAITVPGDLKREVAIGSFTVSTTATLQQFTLSLQNKGNVSADVKATVSLKDTFGNVQYTNGGQYPVLRDQKLELTFDNTTPPFWGGWYQAQAEVVYDKQAGNFGVSDDPSELVTVSSDPITLFVAPSFGALLIYAAGLLVIIGALSWRYIGRRLKKSRLENWVDYTVLPGDTIQSVAEQHAASWKKLASVNAIKPPYVLTPGQILKVPAPRQTPAPRTPNQEK